VPPVIFAMFWAGYSLSGRLDARAEPTLPNRTPTEVADLASSPHPQPRSGFLELNTNLGLGDFSTAGGGGGSGPFGLAAGSNMGRLWEDGAQRRIALLRPLEETDWYRIGDATYVWHSNELRATKVPSPSVQAGASGLITSLASGGTIESPDGMAARFLALRDQSTRLVLHAPAYVAGRPAYQLGLIPQTSTSLITEVVVGVDAATGLPLSVKVHTRSGTVAIESKFTSITFKRPAATNFSFTTPPEARLTDSTQVSRTPDYSGDWRREHQRAEALADVQSVSGIDQALLKLATTGQGWDETVAVSGFSWWRLDRLGNTAKAVSGPYGNGRLLETPAFNLLILDSGRIVAGAVTPEGLVPAATQIAGTR
jgi:hypothetical protein